MKLTKILPLAVVSLTIGTTAALAGEHGNKYVHSRLNNGQVYVMYQNHMSLYTFDKDEIGQSNCYDECAVKWPPALVKADTPLGESYSAIKRKDGTLQAAFRGMPLYFWSGDKKIGDIKGDGIGGVWRLAKP